MAGRTYLEGKKGQSRAPDSRFGADWGRVWAPVLVQGFPVCCCRGQRARDVTLPLLVMGLCSVRVHAVPSCTMARVRRPPLWIREAVLRSRGPNRPIRKWEPQLLRSRPGWDAQKDFKDQHGKILKSQTLRNHVFPHNDSDEIILSRTF